MVSLEALRRAFPLWAWAEEEGEEKSFSSEATYYAELTSDLILELECHDPYHQGWLWKRRKWYGPVVDGGHIVGSCNEEDARLAIIGTLIEAARRALTMSKPEEARYYLRSIRHA